MKKIAIILFIILLSLIIIPSCIQDDSDRVVYITATGTKYHLSTCSTLKNTTKISITLKEAKDAGYTACGICKP